MPHSLVSLCRYPVKSLGGNSVPQIEMTKAGPLDDRRWMVVQPNGHFLTRRDLPDMAHISARPHADGVVLEHHRLGERLIPFPDDQAEIRQVEMYGGTISAQIAQEEASRYLSAILKEDVDLAFMHDETVRVGQLESEPHMPVRFADAYPLLITNQSSLDAFNDQTKMDLEMIRFRANIILDLGEAWSEDTIKRLRIGAVSFVVAKACERCIMVTQDPNTGLQTHGLEPLAQLRKIHGNQRGRPIFGQNAIPENEGVIRLGDEIEILETGPSNL